MYSAPATSTLDSAGNFYWFYAGPNNTLRVAERLASGELSFTTLNPGFAEAVTTAPSSVSEEQATLNGTVNPVGRHTKFYFQYGETKAYRTTTAEGDAGEGASAIREIDDLGTPAGHDLSLPLGRDERGNHDLRRRSSAHYAVGASVDLRSQRPWQPLCSNRGPEPRALCDRPLGRSQVGSLPGGRTGTVFPARPSAPTKPVTSSGRSRVRVTNSKSWCATRLARGLVRSRRPAQGALLGAGIEQRWHRQPLLDI